MEIGSQLPASLSESRFKKHISISGTHYKVCRATCMIDPCTSSVNALHALQYVAHVHVYVWSCDSSGVCLLYNVLIEIAMSLAV